MTQQRSCLRLRKPVRKFALAATIVAGCLATSHPAEASPWSSQIAAARDSHAAVAPAGRADWYGFSPDDDGMGLVLYGVYSARTSIHVLAYVLTYRPLIEALAAKARSGVEVSVVVDYGENIANDRDGYIRKGLAYLARSGASVCATDQYRLLHDKAMILDGRNVQTGSINYTQAGAQSNSENAVIHWNDQQVSAAFDDHFQSRRASCRPLS